MPGNTGVPPIQYGYGTASKALDLSVPYAVVTMDVPWSLVRGFAATPPQKIVEPTSMTLDALESMARLIPKVEVIFGIGGGTAHDAAKFVAMQQGCRLIQIPTMIGGDAALTPPVGIREEGRVRYVGSVPCDRVVVDYAILQNAPPELVRVGACDCLSSETALRDWRVAAGADQAAWDEAVSHDARRTLDSIRRSRFQIRDCTPRGIRAIFDGFASYAGLALDLGNDRAQEGSEHFLAYFVEFLTQRSYVHGQLLGVCLAAVAYLFGESFSGLMSTLGDMGINTDPTRIGITADILIDALVGLQDFVREGGYYYTHAHERAISRTEARESVRALTSVK